MAAGTAVLGGEIEARRVGGLENASQQDLNSTDKRAEIQGRADHDHKKALRFDDQHSPLRPSTPDGLDQPSDKNHFNDRTAADMSSGVREEATYKPHTVIDMYMKFTLLCLRLVSGKIFQNFITFVIMLASLMVGMQTYPALEDDPILNVADRIILAIFTIECALKILAVGLRPWEYVYDTDGVNFWNVFDFIVVLVCYLPLDASMVTVIRLFRLLRVLKLVRALPELQILVMGLIGSIPSIFYVALLLCLVYYLYGIMCLSFFQENDPVNFWDLQTTFLTLFRMSTLDDWVDIMYTAMYGNDVVPCDPWRSSRCTDTVRQPWLASLFFVSFTVLSAFVVLNLFIGVVATQMEEAKGRLQKENDNRGNMSGCEDEFDIEERMAKLISLRFDDMSEECGSILSEIKAIAHALENIESRRKSRQEMVSDMRASSQSSYSAFQARRSQDSTAPTPNMGGRVLGADISARPDKSVDANNRMAQESHVLSGVKAQSATTASHPGANTGSGTSLPQRVTLPSMPPVFGEQASLGLEFRGSPAAAAPDAQGRQRSPPASQKDEEMFVKEVTRLQAKLQHLQDTVPNPMVESPPAGPTLL